MKVGYDSLDCMIGKIYIVADESGIRRIELFEDKWNQYIKTHPHLQKDEILCRKAIEELKEYFDGKRKTFTVGLSIQKGTDFQKKVWEALKEIPYGMSKSYQHIAETIGNPKAVRAVGQANRANPIPIIIPCHRVIGKNGKLTGYAGNRIGVKETLLQLEGVKI